MGNWSFYGRKDDLEEFYTHETDCRKEERGETANNKPKNACTYRKETGSGRGQEVVERHDRSLHERIRQR